MKFTPVTLDLVDCILTLAEVLVLCFISYVSGYEKRSRELETDFDFEKDQSINQPNGTKSKK